MSLNFNIKIPFRYDRNGIFELLLERCDKSENSVDCEENAHDDYHNIKRVSERKHKTNYNGKNGEYQIKRIRSLFLECVDKSNDTLDGDKYSKNEKHYLRSRPAKNEYRDTDDKADSSACVILLYQVKYMNYLKIWIKKQILILQSIKQL